MSSARARRLSGLRFTGPPSRDAPERRSAPALPGPANEGRVVIGGRRVAALAHRLTLGIVRQFLRVCQAFIWICAQLLFGFARNFGPGGGNPATREAYNHSPLEGAVGKAGERQFVCRGRIPCGPLPEGRRTTTPPLRGLLKKPLRAGRDLTVGAAYYAALPVRYAGRMICDPYGRRSVRPLRDHRAGPGPHARKKGTARPFGAKPPGRAGRPFFRLAKRRENPYKGSGGCPLVPVPGSRTQTLNRERYSLLYHEGSNQRAPPFSSFLSLIRAAPASVAFRPPERVFPVILRLPSFILHASAPAPEPEAIALRSTACARRTRPRSWW